MDIGPTLLRISYENANEIKEEIGSFSNRAVGGSHTGGHTAHGTDAEY